MNFLTQCHGGGRCFGFWFRLHQSFLVHDGWMFFSVLGFVCSELIVLWQRLMDLLQTCSVPMMYSFGVLGGRGLMFGSTYLGKYFVDCITSYCVAN